jgi:hypothetical protein
MVNKTEQAEAQYRVVLKRILRAAGQIIDNNAPNADLESRLDAVVKYAPGIVSRGLHRMYEDAAKAWEHGNNSGNSGELSKGYADCDRYRAAADRVLNRWGVTVDYPGLYPSFNYKGHDYYTPESVLREVAEAMKAEVTK